MRARAGNSPNTAIKGNPAESLYGLYLHPFRAKAYRAQAGEVGDSGV